LDEGENMGSASTAAFCKRKTCPTARTLLLFHGASLKREASRHVAAHLSSCDFCGAELHLLSRFPPAGPPLFRPARMPRSLFRLAKDLLSLRGAETVYERAGLTLTDA
jgi:hypothetical protein